MGVLGGRGHHNDIANIRNSLNTTKTEMAGWLSTIPNCFLPERVASTSVYGVNPGAAGPVFVASARARKRCFNGGCAQKPQTSAATEIGRRWHCFPVLHGLVGKSGLLVSTPITNNTLLSLCAQYPFVTWLASLVACEEQQCGGGLHSSGLSADYTLRVNMRRRQRGVSVPVLSTGTGPAQQKGPLFAS
eukprot:76859-Amphidinium_carterae.1